MTVTVAPVGPEAAAEVLQVVRAAFAERPALHPPADALAETEESLAALLARRGGLLARLDGRPVGSVVLDPDPDGGAVSWRRFGVVPDAQGHGVAGALVQAALDASHAFDRVVVLAREELPATVDFWRRHDFWVAERTPPYLRLTRRPPELHEVPTAGAMHALGERVAGSLRAGDLVVLTGELGAGKTTFAQGVGAGLRVRGAVTSPTFVIARVHPSEVGGPALVHVDAYRLGGAAELDDLDLDTSLDQAVTLVEWGEGLAETLAESRLSVRIRRATGAPGPHDPDDRDDPQAPDDPDDPGADPRRVELSWLGPRWDDRPARQPAGPAQ